ncbi:MAG: hypothetical protein ACW98D_08810 [Promethearchaeota archaeon]|jgi:hypothetical protein
MSSTKKKSTQQTISISPELKERIENYVMINQEKFPDDKRFRSISSFYTNVMEQVLECFEKGKTLDDFDSFVDGEVKDFFEKISFNGLIPYYESAVRPNRYTNPTLEKNPFFFFTLRRFWTSQMDPNDITSIKTFFNRVRNYILANNISKEFRLDLFTGKGKKDLTAVFEHTGIYKELSFENYKFSSAIFGLLGVKITNLLYSREENYCRFDLKVTDLFYRKELAKRERIKLIEHNVSYLINYFKIVEDKDYYLWMKIAEDKNAIISFINEGTKQEWVNLIESEIEKFGDKEDYNLNMLRLFESLHWIEIENDKDLIFHIRLSKIRHQNEREFLLSTLSKYSSIEKANGNHYLKKREL